MTLSSRLSRVRQLPFLPSKRQPTRPEGLTAVQAVLWQTAATRASGLPRGAASPDLHQQLVRQVVHDLGNSGEAVDALRSLYENDQLPGLPEQRGQLLYELTALRTPELRRLAAQLILQGENRFTPARLHQVVREVTLSFTRTPSDEELRDLQTLRFFTEGAADEGHAYLSAFATGADEPASRLPRTYYAQMRQILTGLEHRREVGLFTRNDPRVDQPESLEAWQHARAAGFLFAPP